MKVLIVSDTHRQHKTFFKVLEVEKPIDLLLHCGDVEGAEYTIEEAAGCPVKFVAGNNDYFSDLPLEQTFHLGKYSIWMTHGHHYSVSMNYEILKEEAMQRGVDIVLFGHTHKPVLDMGSGLIAINPGSLTYPRTPDRRASYVVMDIAEDGTAEFAMNYVN